MGYRYEEKFRQLQPGDVSGAVLLYGKRQPDTITAASQPASEPRDLSTDRAVAKRSGARAFTERPQ